MRPAWRDPSKYGAAPLEKLSLEALTRIEARLAGIESKLNDYEIKKPQYEARVAAHVAQLEIEIKYLHEKAEPLIKRSGVLWQILNKHVIGNARQRHDSMVSMFLSAGKAMLTPDEKCIVYEGRKFRACVNNEIEEVNIISEKINEISNQIQLIKARISKPELGLVPQPPVRKFQISDQLNNFTVDVDRINRPLLLSLIADKKKEKWEREEVHQVFKAKASAYDNKQRDYAKAIRNRIKKQLLDSPDCPYCGFTLDSSQVHADHIYPVALGGLSTQKNMIYVCRDCNQKKGTRTLREFIQKYGLDERFVHQNLEKLKKTF